jgi:hypothetical protein
MADIERAREVLQNILNLPNASKEAQYYAKLALSHLQEEPDAKRVHGQDKAPDLRS